jgi:hypothetical protein
VLGEGGLDLLGVDVLAAADDPVHEDQVAVAVQVADVTGVQPSVADDFAGLVWLAKVAAHHVRAADHDFSALPLRLGFTRGGDDRDLLPWHRAPHRPGLTRTAAEAMAGRRL